MRSSKQLLIWAAIFVLGVIGPVVAADYGGVLHWTQYVSALAVALLGLMTVAIASTREHQIGFRQLLPVVPVLIWIAYGWAQCVSMDASAIAVLSPGSHFAYTGWLSPILPSDELPQSFPISIAPDASRHALGVLTLVPVLLCSVLVVCRDRVRSVWGLLLLAFGIGLHAVYGIASYVFPELSFQDGDAHKIGFGSYVNQNNIGFLFNIGVACSLSLVTARARALSTVTRSGRHAAAMLFQSLMSADRIGCVGFICFACCLAGLLMCGSKSALIAVLCGGIVTYLWMRRADGWLTIPTAVAVAFLVVLMSVFLLAPFAESLGSVDEFREVDLRNDGNLLGTARLQHWPDGIHAALEYFPAGSGIATYAYAYLPYQTAVQGVWFHHADNLWLELLVEQGVPGAILASAVFGVIVIALLRLSRSTDPLDYGLQAGCAYFLGITLWSQAFDFGLILPGNLFAATVFLGVVIARGQMINTRDGDSQGVRFATLRSRITSAVIVGLVLVPLCFSLPLLRNDAVAEYLTESIERDLSSDSIRRESLEEHRQALRVAADGHPRSGLYDLDSDLNRRLARLKLLEEKDPRDLDQLNEALAATEATELSRQWRVDPSAIKELPAGYAAAVGSARKSLCRLPLGIFAREHVASLDFAHQQRVHADASFRQLAELQKGSADCLSQLASMAGTRGDESAAAKLWKEATAIDAAAAKDALQHALSDASREISNYIDDQPLCQRYVSRYLLDNPANNSEYRAQAMEFLSRSLGLLECDQCESREERSSCEEVAGRIFLARGNRVEALAHLNDAIKQVPADIAKRRRVIQWLIEGGLRQEALRLAADSYGMFPEHYPFKRIADELTRKSAVTDGIESP